MSHPSDASPFASTGRALLARGYSPLPIKPGDKAPGAFDSSEWRMMRGWSKYCTSRPTGFHVDLWSKWPNAGVGVACGSGLVLVDIDMEEVVKPLLAVLPPCMVAKKGAKGLTIAFRGDTLKIKSRAFKINKVGYVDLLSTGKQSVLPPSIHPRTGEPYTWTTTRTLIDTSLAELPEAPDDLAQIIADALKPFGYEAEPEAPAYEWDGAVQESRSQATDFFRRLNEDALANLDAWVPKLSLPKAVRNGSNWRAVAGFRPSSSGTPTNKRKMNLSFDPKGIRDFGDGDKAYTPLNVVMAACDLGNDLDTAAKWLGTWIGYDFSPIIDLQPGSKAPSVIARKAEEARQALSSAKPAQAPVRAPLAPHVAPAPLAPAAVVAAEPAPPERPLGNIAAALAGADQPSGEVVPFAPPVSYVAPQTARFERSRKLKELTKIPGLVGELIDWMDAVAKAPCRELSLGAALCAVGTVAGRHYATPTNLRTNLYIVALAGSGHGKGNALDCILQLFSDHGMDRFLGGSDIASGTGLRERLIHSPSSLYLIDEYAKLIREMHDKRAGQHVASIKYNMMKLYSAAASVFKGTDYAAGKTPDIRNPNLSVYGVSTQFDFWNGLGAQGVADGFLPRQILLNVEGEGEPRKPTANVWQPPRSIIDQLHRIMETRSGNLAGATNDSATKVDPYRMAWGVGAEDLWDGYEIEIRDARREAEPELHSVLNRIAENAQKMAAVVAIGVDPVAPVITADILQWGFELSWLSAESMFDEITSRLAHNDYQRDYLDVRRLIEDSGPEGIGLTELKKRLNGRLDQRRFNDINEMLRDSEDIETQHKQNPRGGRPGARFVYTRQSKQFKRK